MGEVVNFPALTRTQKRKRRRRLSKEKRTNPGGILSLIRDYGKDTEQTAETAGTVAVAAHAKFCNALRLGECSYDEKRKRLTDFLALHIHASESGHDAVPLVSTASFRIQYATTLFEIVNRIEEGRRRGLRGLRLYAVAERAVQETFGFKLPPF